MKKKILRFIASLLLLTGCTTSEQQKSEEEIGCKDIYYEVQCIDELTYNNKVYKALSKENLTEDMFKYQRDELIGYIIEEKNYEEYDLDKTKEFFFDNNLATGLEKHCIQDGLYALYVYSLKEYPNKDLLCSYLFTNGEERVVKLYASDDYKANK